MKNETYSVNEYQEIFVSMAFEAGAQSDDKGQHQASGYIAKHFSTEPNQA